MHGSLQQAILYKISNNFNDFVCISKVDQAGKPHQENINKLIDSTMPEIARADAKTKFSGCLELHGNMNNNSYEIGNMLIVISCV